MHISTISFWLGIILLFHTYFGYYFLLLVITKFLKRGQKNINQKVLYSVDIVIAAYNEESVIEEKIKNCLFLDYPKELLNVWVASDGSVDRTNVIVEKFAQENPQVHLLALSRCGKAQAINTAMEKVSSDIVVFSDANTEYDTKAIERLLKHFIDKKVGCVCGRLIYRNPNEVRSGVGESFYWRYETMLKILESKLGYVAGANGAIYAIRRKLFTRLPDDTINDDFMTSMNIIKNGFKCLYEREALAYEFVAPTVIGEFRRHVRDGAGHYRAMIELVGLMNPFYGLRAFIYLSHRVIRWLAPFILIFLFVVNIFLMKYVFYRYVFVFQTLFYAFAIYGLTLVKKKSVKIPVFVYVPFYFCNLNLAMLIGCCNVILGTQKTMWESTSRTN